MDTTFLYSPDPKSPFCHCPSIWYSEIQGILLTWYVYPEKEHQNASIVFARSNENSKGFGPSKIVVPSRHYSHGNPIIFEADSQIHIYFVTIQGRYWDDSVLFSVSSKDRGKTWSSPKSLQQTKGLMVRHPPIRATNNDLLLGVYHESQKTSSILRSTNEGKSWNLDHTFPRRDIIQPTLSRVGKEILCFFRPCDDPNVIWQCKYDGNRWMGVKSTNLPCPLSGLDSFTYDNNVNIIYNHSHRLQRTPLSLTKYSHKTDSYSHPWDFEQNNLEVSYPSFTSNRDQIHGVYTYNRRMIKYVHYTKQDFLKNVKEKSQDQQDHRHNIDYYKGLHRDKNLFILASGPSLAGLDLTPLDRRITMGLNRSGLVYPETTYHCVMDQRLFDEYEELLRKTRTLFTLEGRPFGIPIKLLGTEGFSTDCKNGVYSGYTIAYLALQIAVYMGFKNIFFLGLDLQHNTNKTHFFGHDYRSKNHEHTEFPKMLKMLTQSKKFLDHHGVTAYNCSPRSKLEAFNKISYQEALQF